MNTHRCVTLALALSAVSVQGCALEDGTDVEEVAADSGALSSVLHVAPDGRDSNPGTEGRPTTLTSAITRIAPGGTIFLRGGTYRFSDEVHIRRGNDGSAGRPKKIFAAEGERPILDFSSERYSDGASGLHLSGNHWHIRGLEVKGAADNGIYIAGNSNKVEDCEVHHNRDTGIQIRRDGSAARRDWPSSNLVLNCVSHDNADPDNGEDADGFAAKLTVGPGNVFRGCIAHHNVDDGWDLFTKEETGPISPVTIEGCVAFNNGELSDGSSSARGDGNGFKLGGQGIPVNHVVRGSIAFDNRADGFTFNNNPGAIQVTSNTAFRNGGSNFQFDRGSHVFTNNLSFRGGDDDTTSGRETGGTNVWWKRGRSTNSGRLEVSDADFVSLTPLVRRRPDGTPNLRDFLRLHRGSDLVGSGSPRGTNIGAR